MLQQQQFDELLAYWLELQRDNGGKVPRRRQFNPMRVAKLLPYVFIVERREEFNLHVRIVGTAIEAVVGRSLTGCNYLDMYDDCQWGFFAGMTDAMCSQPCGGKLDREVIFNSGKQFDMHSLNLPLANEAGEVIYILGLMAMRRSAYHHDMAGGSTVKVFTVRDFEFIDLGYGLPESAEVKARLQKVPA